MVTLTFGSPVFDGACNGAVVDAPADGLRGERMPTPGAGWTVAPSPGWEVFSAFASDDDRLRPW